MKIASMELRHIRMPLQSPFRTSFGVEEAREALLLRATAGGIEGWGECVAGAAPGYSYETVGTAWHILSEFFIPACLQVELDGPSSVARALAAYKGHPFARAALEMAVWDIMGKAQGRPLAAILGGEAHRVPVGVSVGIQADKATLLEVVEGYLQQGYGRVKLKIQPGYDLAPVRAVRQAYPTLRLQVDANSAYRLDDGDIFREMDDLGLLMIEQPLADDDIIDHAALQSELDTPICLDESIRSLRHARQALALDAARVINIKQARVGGLTEAVRVHDLCRVKGIPVWCGGMLETGVGRAANLALAALPGFSLPGDISATERYYARDIATPAFVLNADSTIDVPSEPGLGVWIDTAYLDQVTVKSQTFSCRHRFP
jgi:O-succinylbenzoate synthase